MSQLGTLSVASWTRIGLRNTMHQCGQADHQSKIAEVQHPRTSSTSYSPARLSLFHIATLPALPLALQVYHMRITLTEAEAAPTMPRC